MRIPNDSFKVIQLPNKKVMRFSTYQRVYYGNIEAVVYPNRESYDHHEHSECECYKCRENVRCVYKERDFWCKATTKRANELEKLVKKQQEYVYTMWLVGDIHYSEYDRFLNLGK